MLPEVILDMIGEFAGGAEEEGCKYFLRFREINGQLNIFVVTYPPDYTRDVNPAPTSRSLMKLYDQVWMYYLEDMNWIEIESYKSDAHYELECTLNDVNYGIQTDRNGDNRLGQIVDKIYNSNLEVLNTLRMKNYQLIPRNDAIQIHTPLGMDMIFPKIKSCS
jgi:hypothetical protein